MRNSIWILKKRGFSAKILKIKCIQKVEMIYEIETWEKGI